MDGSRFIIFLCSVGCLSVGCRSPQKGGAIPGSDMVEREAPSNRQSDVVSSEASRPEAGEEQASKNLPRNSRSRELQPAQILKQTGSKPEPGKEERSEPEAGRKETDENAEAAGPESESAPEAASLPEQDLQLETREMFWPDGSQKRQWMVKVLADGTEVQHGPWRAWHQNGQPYLVGQYVEGIRDGLWLAWHTNGRKRGEGTFKKDVRVGTWTMWHDNGQKRMDIPYVDGLMQGTWTFWDEQGNLVETGEYVRGEKHGTWTKFDEQGKTETHWDHGQQLP